MKNSITIAAVCLIGLNSFGQGLRLTRGLETKEFKGNSVFEMVLAEEDPTRNRTYCDYLELVGTFKSVKGDSLFLQLSSLVDHRLIDDASIEQSLLFHSNVRNYPVSTNQIVFLKRYKSDKSRKARQKLGVAGGILLFTGAATALNALVVKGKSNKNNLLLSGGLQIGLGIGFGIASTAKKYYLKNRSDQWAIDPG